MSIEDSNVQGDFKGEEGNAPVVERKRFQFKGQASGWMRGCCCLYWGFPAESLKPIDMHVYCGSYCLACYRN